MNRVLREQRRCCELAEARRMNQYLEERLAAAEAQIREQDVQIEEMVKTTNSLVGKVIGMAPLEFVQGEYMVRVLTVLKQYHTIVMDDADI